MHLHDNRHLFLKYISQASKKISIDPSFVEKDYYAISTLKELLRIDNNFVFKGGTSLSVCHHAINRFSEDVDISYIKHKSRSGKRELKQEIFQAISNMGLEVANPEFIRSRRLVNPYRCPYKSVFSEVGDKIIIEWSSMEPVFPYEIKTAQTILGKYLHSIGRDDLVSEYGLEAFEVKTQSLIRTMVDKTFAICDYYLRGSIKRNSRHLYDLYQLLKIVKLDDNFITLFEQVRELRKPSDRSLSAKEGQIVSSILKEIVDSSYFRNDYNTVTSLLLYDGVKYNEAITSLEKIGNFLKQHNL